MLQHGRCAFLVRTSIKQQSARACETYIFSFYQLVEMPELERDKPAGAPSLHKTPELRVLKVSRMESHKLPPKSQGGVQQVIWQKRMCKKAQLIFVDAVRARPGTFSELLEHIFQTAPLKCFWIIAKRGAAKENTFSRNHQYLLVSSL